MKVALNMEEVLASRGGVSVEGTPWGYDGAGRRKTATIVGGERDGDWWDYSYNDRGEVVGGVRKDAAGEVLPGYEFGYSFDAIGNRVEAWREAAGPHSAYTANGLNQYESRTVPGEARVQARVEPGTAKVRVSRAGQAPVQVEPLEDGRLSLALPIDNTAAAQFPELTIEAVKPGGTGGTDWRQAQSGHLYVAKTPESFTHDLDGNLTSDGRWTYEWDAENRLTGAETHPGALAAGVPRTRLEFAYDARHRRIRKVVMKGWDGDSYTEQTEHQFVYDDGWNLMAEAITANGQITTKTFLWGLDLSGTRQGAGGVGGLLAERIDGKTVLPCYDGNGNIVRVIEADGSEADTVYEYGPFGEALRATGPMAKENPFGWSTKYADAAIHLCYYGFRYYQPAGGRWLNVDPLAEDGGINLYGFLENTPTNYVDLLGLAEAGGLGALTLRYSGVENALVASATIKDFVLNVAIPNQPYEFSVTVLAQDNGGLIFSPLDPVSPDGGFIKRGAGIPLGSVPVPKGRGLSASVRASYDLTIKGTPSIKFKRRVGDWNYYDVPLSVLFYGKATVSEKVFFVGPSQSVDIKIIERKITKGVRVHRCERLIEESK